MISVRLYTSIAFTWYVLIGSSATVLAACVAALFLGDFTRSPRAPELTSQARE
jgi:hypothetical protein